MGKQYGLHIKQPCQQPSCSGGEKGHATRKPSDFIFFSEYFFFSCLFILLSRYILRHFEAFPEPQATVNSIALKQRASTPRALSESPFLWRNKFNFLSIHVSFRNGDLCCASTSLFPRALMLLQLSCTFSDVLQEPSCSLSVHLLNFLFIK